MSQNITRKSNEIRDLRFTKLRYKTVSVPGRKHLRSAACGQLVVPATQTITIGAKSFHYAGPLAWNNLPISLHDREITLPTFKKHLKTFLFRLR